MELKLNIYKNGKVEKTYTTKHYDIMFGTIEEFLSIIDADKIVNTERKENADKVDNNIEIIKVVTKGLSKLKLLLFDIFEGLTEEELKRTKIKELIPVFVNLFTFAFGELVEISNDSKN